MTSWVYFLRGAWDDDRRRRGERVGVELEVREEVRQRVPN